MKLLHAIVFSYVRKKVLNKLGWGCIILIMSDKKLLIFGEILVDSVEGENWHPGGAPFNVACHLKGFGLNPFFISGLGKDDIGNFLMDKVSAWELDISGISINDKPSGLVDVSIKNGEPSYEILNDRAYDYIEEPDSKLINNSDFLYYGSLAIRSKKSFNTLKSIKNNFKGTVFVDINIRHPWFDFEIFEPFLEGIDWLKVNHHELDELWRADGSLKDKISGLSNRYDIKNIICTMGEDGVTLYYSSTKTFIQCDIKKVKDFKNTIGAGDAFSAMTINSILLNKDKEELLKKSVNFASSICSLEGAIPKNKDLYKQVI